MTTETVAAPLAPSRAAAATPGSAYVDYVDLLRGLAILQIVMLHAGNAFLLQGLPEQTSRSAAVHAVNLVLFHDSTLYFSIISGILYSHLFWRRPHGPFFRARLANIGSPYLVMSLVLTAVAWALAARRDGVADWGLFARELVVNILTGDAWNTMWYIPVILGLYAISPILSRLARSARWRWIAVLIVLLPLLISRTGTVLTPAIFVYFGGAFMFGLMLGVALEASIDILRRNLRWLCVAALLATAALVITFATDIDQIGFTSLRETLFYVQRLSMASILLVALHAWSAPADSILRSLLVAAASTSFGVYFVHGPALRPIARLVGAIMPPGQPWWALLAGVVATFLAGLALSLAVVALARLALGKRSRLLIGA